MPLSLNSLLHTSHAFSPIMFVWFRFKRNRMRFSQQILGACTQRFSTQREHSRFPKQGLAKGRKTIRDPGFRK